MSNRANRRKRRTDLHGPARDTNCKALSRAKRLHGRDHNNSRIPTQVNTCWTQPRPEGVVIAQGYWRDPAWSLPDREIPYATLAGVRVNNNSSCTDMRPTADEPKPSANRVQREHRPIRHASEQMDRLSYGDLIQHGIVQERK